MLGMLRAPLRWFFRSEKPPDLKKVRETIVAEGKWLTRFWEEAERKQRPWCDYKGELELCRQGKNTDREMSETVAELRRHEAKFMEARQDLWDLGAMFDVHAIQLLRDLRLASCVPVSDGLELFRRAAALSP